MKPDVSLLSLKNYKENILKSNSEMLESKSSDFISTDDHQTISKNSTLENSSISSSSIIDDSSYHCDSLSIPFSEWNNSSSILMETETEALGTDSFSFSSTNNSHDLNDFSVTSSVGKSIEKNVILPNIRSRRKPKS
jgi:hypothetical protein